MISIILPTYNMEEYLAECLDSIVNQTYKDLEIICVNDASTDNSVVIMQEYAKKDSRIKIINNERNRGLGGARNAGFEVAQGEYVMCVDTDDKLDLRAIELMHKTLKENNADMAFCDMLLYNNDDKTVNVEKPFHDKALSKNNIFCLPDRLYDFTYIWPSTNKMYRKTVIDDNNIRFFENILYEDHTFYYTFLSCSKKVCYVSEPLYVYRIKRQDSIMHESTPRVFEIFTMLDKISDVIYRVFPTEIATTVMPRLAVRLIWERTWHLSGKTKKQFIKTARKYLSKYSKKDLLKYKDIFIDKHCAFFENPLKRFIRKLLKQIFSIQNEYQNGKCQKIIRFLGIKIKLRNKSKELFLKIADLENLIYETKNAQLKISEEIFSTNNKKLDEIFNIVYNIPNKQDNKNMYNAICRAATNTTAQYMLANMCNVPKFPGAYSLLDYALKQVNVEGTYLEFGVYTGNSINHISKQIGCKKMYGFDSFEGLPEDWRTDFEKGTFAMENLPKVNDNVELIKGWFDKTIPEFKNMHSEKCAFIHVDCDLYSSTATIFNLLDDRIQKGTIVVFDEYFNYPGWENGEFKAFQEFIKRTNRTYKYIGYNEIHEQCAVMIL